eukprot:47664_1
MGTITKNRHSTCEINGVKSVRIITESGPYQGACMSGIFWNVYLNPVLKAIDALEKRHNQICMKIAVRALVDDVNLFTNFIIQTPHKYTYDERIGKMRESVKRRKG